jgi:hypothetical protein
MAVRDDISIDQSLSPRVITVAAPSTTLSLQDFVDTVRTLEDDFVNMGFPFLISAAGKEDLGDGVSVAITVQNNNARVAFEARRTPAIDESTVTTASGAPNIVGRYTFIDTGADFVTADVQPGSLVVNWSDRSIGDVVEVISSTELRMEALVNGTDNQMELGDTYSIFNVEQVRISAGNLTAVDDLAAAINAVQPTAFTQVVVAQSSSATLLTDEGLTPAEISDITDAVWDAPTTGHSLPGTFGQFIQKKLLTVAKFLGLS